MSNSQPKILVYSPKQAKEYAAYIRQHGYKHIQTATTSEEAAAYLPGTEIILGWKFPLKLLNTPLASAVRWFQSTGAGVDDFTSESSIPDHIILTRIVNQFGSYISEYVFTYILYLLKDVPRMRKSQSEHHWDPFITDTLAGKKIGVAGLGSIGREIVRKARAFDMEVFGLSVSGQNAGIVDHHFTPLQWTEFVKELDYLVLTLPLTESTHHVINRDVLSAMKQEAGLINVGRGALIDEKALIEVLNSGHLQAAVLDVFETEPLPDDHLFYSIPNIFVTSHLSGPSTIEGVSQFFSDNLKRYCNKQPLLGLVDRKKGY